MRVQNISVIISYVLVALWAYAGGFKLFDFNRSQQEMVNQVFSRSTANTLVWAVPAIELIAGTLLIFKRTRLAGLYASLLLLVSFTVYIGLVMNNVFGRIPCSCGGILEKMSWEQHLVFNMVFILVTSTAILLSTDFKEGGCMGKGK